MEEFGGKNGESANELVSRIESNQKQHS